MLKPLLIMPEQKHIGELEPPLSGGEMVAVVAQARLALAQTVVLLVLFAYALLRFFSNDMFGEPLGQIVQWVLIGLFALFAGLEAVIGIRNDVLLTNHFSLFGLLIGTPILLRGPSARLQSGFYLAAVVIGVVLGLVTVMAGILGQGWVG